MRKHLKPNIDKWLHRAIPIYLVGMALAPVDDLLPRNGWGQIGTVIAFTAITAFWLSLYHGGRRFCEYCAANSPLDGNDTAEKKRSTLRFFHQSRTWWGIGYLLVFIVVPFLLPMVWPRFIGDALLTPGFIWYVWSGRIHGLLRPWCPYCHHGRGDGGDGLWEPSPGPSHGRPLPVGPSNG